MRTLKDLKEAVAKASHITLVNTDKPHKFLNIKRKIRQVNTVGFSSAPDEGSEASYLDWPKASELTFHPAAANQFTVRSHNLTLRYELHFEG